eukprot:TRINITY_DN34446_c0_g1_i1.p1 TRINITY_DN34446_c0_g1~~TRINITY_DN34446_c0_g1_i1.p1  ORF type:complete len:533 (-),score=84.14 TRINITY_DN34446_c0_g1_i1:75-1616(-)
MVDKVIEDFVLMPVRAASDLITKDWYTSNLRGIRNLVQDPLSATEPEPDEPVLELVLGTADIHSHSAPLDQLTPTFVRISMDDQEVGESSVHNTAPYSQPSWNERFLLIPRASDVTRFEVVDSSNRVCCSCALGTQSIWRGVLERETLALEVPLMRGRSEAGCIRLFARVWDGQPVPDTPWWPSGGMDRYLRPKSQLQPSSPVSPMVSVPVSMLPRAVAGSGVLATGGAASPQPVTVMPMAFTQPRSVAGSGLGAASPQPVAVMPTAFMQPQSVAGSGLASVKPSNSILGSMHAVPSATEQLKTVAMQPSISTQPRPGEQAVSSVKWHPSVESSELLGSFQAQHQPLKSLQSLSTAGTANSVKFSTGSEQRILSPMQPASSSKMPLSSAWTAEKPRKLSISSPASTTGVLDGLGGSIMEQEGTSFASARRSPEGPLVPKEVQKTTSTTALSARLSSTPPRNRFPATMPTLEHQREVLSPASTVVRSADGRSTPTSPAQTPLRFNTLPPAQRVF